jgi:peptide/nickel transport system permease protein
MARTLAIRRLVLQLVWAALTLVGASAIVFFMANSVPADPVAAYVGPKADQETRNRIRDELGLRDPLWQQYGRYLGRLVRGDLGQSYVTQEPVAEAIWTRFPATLALSLGGLAVWVLLGVPLGVVTARYRNSFFDRTVLVAAMVTLSVPTFWLGRLLQFELAYRRGYFPVAGLLSWQHLILPCLTLGIVGVGYYARLVHSNVVEVLNLDYIRAARARGLAEPVVLFKHALRNALLPVLTVLGMDVATLLGGVIFTESIFALPGIGQLALQAVLNLDVPMIMGTVMFSAALVVGMNLLVDVIYRVVDPRIRAA